MEQIPAAELERVMRVQDVMLRAMAKKITWWQAAEILGVSDRTMRRWKAKHEEHGLRMMVDGRKGQRNWRKVDASEVDRVLTLSYYAQLVEAECTRSVMAALRDVVERFGWFASIYSDRASHFFHTPKGGGPVDFRQLSQVGRAMKDLGIRMIPAYSPQARGRSERSFGTWQGRLPQELRLRKITIPEEANRFLRDSYIDEFNQKFARAAAGEGTAFVPLQRDDLDRVFAVQHERVVNNDNTIQWDCRSLQIERTPIRSTMAGLNVIVYEHLDGTVSIGYGPHTIGRFASDGTSLDTAPSQRRPPQRRPPLRPKRAALRASLGSTSAPAAAMNRKKSKSR